MKKLLKILGILILATITYNVVSMFLGRKAGTEMAIKSVENEAVQHNMPTQINGVSWLMSIHTLKSIRPNAVVESSELISELCDYIGRKAKIGYYVKTGNVLMFSIHFLEKTSIDLFNKTNKYLNTNYGPLSEPKEESDKFGDKYCSHRRADRFVIDHCIREQNGNSVESIVLWRTSSK